MQLNRTTAFAAITSTVIGLAAAAEPASAQQTALRIGTSSVGSVFYAVAVGITRLLQEHEKISATVEPVGGSVANVFALGADKIEIAITNSTAAVDGYTGGGRFKGKKVNLGLIAVGAPSLRQFVVRVGSGIEKPEDLKGKTMVGKRPALPELEQLTMALFKVYNIPPSSVKVVATTETNQVVEALKAGTIDAAMMPGSAGAAYLKQLTRDKKITFLDLTDDKANAMLPLVHKAIVMTKLPANSYDGQTKAVNVFDTSTYLVADGRVSEENVYRVMRAIYDHFDEFRTFHSSVKDWVLARSLADPKVPFHPGAVKYLKEKGKWTAELQRKQDALLASK
ncbi:MAG: TAXI family TRAP transporter solute-binding subunit [Hyphomicrobiaceae bacterium]